MCLSLCYWFCVNFRRTWEWYPGVVAWFPNSSSPLLASFSPRLTMNCQLRWPSLAVPVPMLCLGPLHIQIRVPQHETAQVVAGHQCWTHYKKSYALNSVKIDLNYNFSEKSTEPGMKWESWGVWKYLQEKGIVPRVYRGPHENHFLALKTTSWFMKKVDMMRVWTHAWNVTQIDLISVGWGDWISVATVFTVTAGNTITWALLCCQVQSRCWLIWWINLKLLVWLYRL